MIQKMKVSAIHYGDLASAAINGGEESCKIWEKLKPKLEIVENPTPDDFLMDLSVMFMYPHQEFKALDTHEIDGILDLEISFQKALRNDLFGHIKKKDNFK